MGVLGEFRHFRPSALAASLKQIFGGDPVRSRPRSPDRSVFRFELVEPRLLLSADIAPWSHDPDDVQSSAPTTVEHQAHDGMATADARSGWVADVPAGTEQVFWLSTEAAFDIRYDGPVFVDGIQVAAFDAKGLLEGQEDAILDALLHSLESQFGGAGLEFTYERPVEGDFSTIFIGEGASWFDAWGRFGGLAEQIDLGNADKSDLAFVFTDVLDGGLLSAEAYGRGLAKVVGHEAGHLLGLEHAHDNGDGPLAGVAFDPRVHAEIGKDVLADVAGDPNVIGDADGKVTIEGQEYAVHPLLVKALDEYQAYYNAGTVAGDGFPDVLMGQFAIHPIEHGTWLTRILDMAWSAQGDPSYSADQQLQILAWSYGFLTHSAGDHWAHTLVNDIAEGVAPGFVAAAQDARDLGNMLRHFMVEAYIADAMPGVDTNPDRELHKGDYTDDSTPAITFEAPIRFIYEALIRPFAQDPTPVVEMKWSEGTLSAVPNGSGDDFFERSAGSFKDDGFKEGHKITVAGFGANSGTFFVTSVSADGKQLFVSGALNDSPGNGQASGDETIVVKVPATAKVDIDYVVAGTVAKFVRNDGGSFVADGFVTDMRFSTHGFGLDVPGDFIVKTVSANEIVVVGVPVAASANGSGDEQLVVYGQRGPLVDGLFKLRDALYKKAVETGTRAEAGSFGNRAAQVIEDLITGTSITDDDKDKLFHAYLYNWVDELDEGLRAWGEVGLAFSKAMFDPQSRRDLQNKVGAETGQPDSADVTTLRSKAEDGVGVLDVLIAELDDPNGDDSVGDGFINRHLLPMIGLPQELGMLRTVMVDFGNAVDGVLAPVTDAIGALVNPLKEGIDDLKDYATEWIKKQIEKRWGFSFEVFDYLKDLSAKMDLAEITIPVVGTVPVFREGDHAKLDAILGIDAIPDHHEDPPAGYDSGPVEHVFTFYPDAEGELTDAAEFEKTGANAFTAYANSVTLTRMLLLMEDSGEVEPFLAPAEAAADGVADNQLSKLVNDVRASLGLANVSYDYGNNNLHGAHGGNFLTTTLPGVAGDPPWMLSIDADQVWRQDNYTTQTMLFRIAVDNDALSPAVYEKAVAPGTYDVYVTWQANVTQEVDDEANSLFPDRKMEPAENAAYRVFDDANPAGVVVNKDQRLFPMGLVHTDGLSYSKLGTYAFTGGTAKVSLSNLTGVGQNVLAGPVLLVPVVAGAAIRIANDRDTSTLDAIPGNGYIDDDNYWDDVAYPAGTGNNPLWESDKLRPVFRALFDDYLNDDPITFPDLGDVATVDANLGVGKTERPTHATPFAKDVADNTIEVPITDAVETFIVDGLQDLVDFANSLEDLGPLGVELPGIGKSLGDLLDLGKQFDDAVRKPVLAYFASDTASPTFGEMFDYLKANSPIGASLDSFEGLLEFQLDLSKTFSATTALSLVDEAADSFGLEVNGTLDVAAELAFLRDNLPSFVFGIDLGTTAATAADRLYIRTDEAHFQASVTVPANTLDLEARFGFLGVGVVDGSLAFNAEVSVSIGDGTNNDGRLTLAELAASPSTEILFNAPTGNFTATLPIEVNATFLPPSSLGALGTVSVLAPDLFDPSTYDVILSNDAAFAEVLNFKNIDAASIVGLLGQVTGWLDEFRRSDAFASFDVPVLGTVLDDVLGFADSFRDRFLFDDGDDGVDGAATLIGDLNTALATKGLSDRLHFEVDDTKQLKLVANTGAVSDFSLKTVNGSEIGFNDGLNYSTALTTQLLNSVTAEATAPINGRVGTDVSLKIKFAGEDEVTVVLVKADTDTAGASYNTRIGNDRYRLVDASNTPTFNTVGELITRLADELGLVDVVTYNATENTLDFDLSIGGVFGSKDVSLNFLPADLPDYLKLQTNGMLRLSASGALNLHFGIDLGSAGGKFATADGSGDVLTALNGGIEISSERRIVAANPVGSIVGALSGDSVFQIAVNGGAAKTVTVAKSATANNTTVADLATDYNAALILAGVTGITALPADGNLLFQGLLGTVKGFTVTTTNGDPLVKDLGFLAQTASTSVLGVPKLGNASVVWPNYAPFTGQLSADSVFEVSVNGGVAAAVTVLKSDTTVNTSVTDLVSDFNTALATAGQLITASEFNGNILFTGLLGSTFTVTTASDDPLAKELGFRTQTSSTTVLGIPKLGAASVVWPNYAPFNGKLATDSVFQIAVNGAAAKTVTVPKTTGANNTADNTNVADLVSDFNTALVLAGLAGQVTATETDGNVQFQGLAGSSFTLNTTSVDPLVKELGFLAQSSSTVTVVGGVPKISTAPPAAPAPVKPAPTLLGRLGTDATFTINLGSSSQAVTVAAASTSNNSYAFDIVSDVQAAIDATALTTKVDPADSTTWVRNVVVGIVGGKLTFTSKTQDTTFTITGANSAAQTGLGLAGGTEASDGADLVIGLRSGASVRVDLSGATSLADVIGKIEDASRETVGGPIRVDVAINARQTGLTLTDKTTGSAKFMIIAANDSKAGAQLGIIGADFPQGGDPSEADGVIEGSDIAALRPLDRFFIEENAALGSLTLSIATLDDLADIDLSPLGDLTAEAAFGFVGLKLAGDGTATATLTLGLEDPEADLTEDHRVTFQEVIDNAGTPDALFDLSLTGGGTFSLAITPDVKLDLTALGITVGGTATLDIVADFGDVFADTPIDPTFKFETTGFEDLLKFNNPLNGDLSFQSIVQGLQALSDFLGQFESFGFLGEKLPVVNVSISDLISIAGEFAEAVDQVVANPAGTIQVLEQKLETAFGLPPLLLDLGLVIDKGTDLDSAADDQSFLRITIDLEAGFDESIALELDVGEWLAGETDLPSWITDSINFGGDANLGASGSLGLVLDFGIDLANPLDVYIFEGTTFDASLLATATDVDFRAALGPLGIFVQDGDADINASIGLGLASGLFQGATGAGRVKLVDLINAVASDPKGSVEFTLLTAASATLPVYFPTDSQYGGDVTLTITDLFDPDTINLTLPDGILDFDIGSLNLLDQLLLGVDGVDLFLEGLQDLLDGNIGGVELPLIGDKLAAGVDIIGDFRAGFLEDFRSAVEQLANPTAAFNQFVGSDGTGVAALAGPAEADPVSKILGDLLGSNGLDILLDVNQDGSADGRDIYFKTNLNQPGVALTDVFFDWDIKLGGELLDTGAGIGFDIGIPGLGLQTEGDVTLDVIWGLDLGFGLSYEDGFYLDVGNDADEAYDDDVELQLNIDAAIPGASITGTLGFLQISAEDDIDDGDGLYTHLSAVLGIDIFNGSNKSDTKLGFSELGNIDIDVGIAAEAVVDLGMKLSLSSDLIPNAPTNFPSVVADFGLVWGVGDTTPGSVELVPLSELDGSFLKNGLQYVGFEHVGLDLGSYFSDLIGPIVSKVQEITEPIKPFLDFLTADIPVISQLAGPTSLLDIAAQSGVINPGIIEAIEVVDQVVDIVDSLKDLGNTGNVILYFDEYLPSLVIYGQKPAAGVAALSVPDTPNIDLSKAPNLDELKKYADDFLPEGWGGALSGIVGDVGGAFANSLSKMQGTGSAAKGFSLPIIEDPSQIFGMLLGQPATLVQFDMAPLILEADYSQFFPIYGPLGVSINAEFGAQFGPFSFGYDTLGITSFADGDFRNPGLLFDGFFVSDVDANGVDVPELQFDAGLWAAAELNLGVARGGVGGGLFAEIDFDLHDPDDDGRVRVKEMVANVYNEFKYFDKALAPLALFDITGQLTAELFAFLKVDLLLLQIDERWQLTEPITLLDFESDFTRVPTLANELGNGVLQLNMGKYAKQRIEGDLTDGNEHFEVKSAGGGDVYVWSTLVDFDGDGYDEGEAQRYNASNLIMALGGEGDDTIDLSGVTTAIKFDIEGNAGVDTIKLGRTSAGASGKVLGGSGNDVIEGSDGADNIFGEDGEDTISGHGGRDWLFGDGKPVDSIRADKVRTTAADIVSVPSVDAYILSSAAKATDDHDVIDGGDDEDVIFGGGGEDTLDGGDGADVILGDGGEVIVGTDRVAMTTRVAGDDAGRLELRVSDTGKGKGAKDTIDGEGGNDRVYGGGGDDSVDGGADEDVIFGEDGKDTLHGGGQDDVLFGDGGSFAFVNSVLSPVTTSGGDADKLYGDDGSDKLLGGAGNDEILGGDGADDAWGGVGLDVIHGDGGNDHLYGGGDPDKLYGDIGDDYLEGGQANDFVLGGIGDDLLIAGYGSDTLDGEGGSDTYKINARGGSITDLTTAYDSGSSPTDTDLMLLVGTPDRDVVLLRAMADFYFPTLEKLIGDGPKNGLTDKIFASGEADKLAAVLQVLEDSYGPHEIPAGLVDQIIDLWVADRAADLAQAIDDSYQSPAIQSIENPPPTKAELKAKITEILATNSREKLDEMREAIKLLWDGYRVPGTMLDAIAQAWQPETPTLQNDVEDAISNKYMSEALVGLITLAQDTYKPGNAASYAALTAAIDAAHDSGTMPASMKTALDDAYDGGIGTVADLVAALKSGFAEPDKWSAVDTDTAFVALINNGGKNIERFNYRYIEGLVVNTLQGEDYVASDDVAATTTINLGDDADKVQIGQVFRSERVRDPEGELITGIDPSDGFTTTEITRGWLSNGVSRATTVNGGEGNDQFTVFRNVATVNLNGNDGDDLFTVRAFALKGSSDNERARTDMKGDGGADTILYVVNAPVGIDGGDGFDTVRIVGTEFGDDFVVTDAGIFGAGLNVSYVNIEKLVADGAEGDDRFFVLSTGVEVVTEIDGGLGSDSFFVGGNPSRAPVAVISNDFKGHSGVILHSIESGDPSWNGVPVEGLSANVADNSEPMILVYEHAGMTRVFEDATGTLAGWAYDSYGIRLSSRPDDDVYITVVPAGLSPEDAARGFKDLEFFDAETVDGFPAGAALGFNINTGLANLPVIKFTPGNWDQVQYVKFRAATDTAAEGTRTTFINHTAQNSSDQAWAGVQSRSVKVQLLDDDRDAVIVTPTKGANVVLEHSTAGATGFTDSIDVRLARDPSAAVTVNMRVANEQITLSGAGITHDAVNGVYTFTVADDAAWDTARTIMITAPDDAVVEGLHTDYISFEVVSADVDATVQKQRFKLNGDFDNLVGPPLDIPADKPTSYLLLPDRPITNDATTPITVWLNDSPTPLDADRFSVSGSTLTFLDANGTPQFVTGKVEIAYSFVVVGYNGSFVKDSVVDIYDEDTAMVIIDQSDSAGSLDVVEDNNPGGQSVSTDSYRVRLTRAPAAGETVTFKFDAVETRTTYGSTALFAEQVTVNGLSVGSISFDGVIDGLNDWNAWQTIQVRAINDNKLDGNDTQVFAPELQTVNKIRGPLIIEGAAGAGSLALPKPLMMPWELNKLAADGVIQAVRAVPGSEGAGAREVITVTEDALSAVIARLSQQDSNIDSFSDLKGKTLELSSGPGTGIVLNDERPDDLYDRFWLILEVGPVVGGKVELLVQNPSIVDPADPVVVAPVPEADGDDIAEEGETDFAITSLSINFFADEREQVDYVFVYDDDSVADDKGWLTSSDGVVRKFELAGNDFVLTAETASLLAVAGLIDPDAKVPDLRDLIGRQLTVTVGPGRGNVYEIQAFSQADAFPDNPDYDGTKKVKLVQVSGIATAPTVRSEFRIEGGDSKGRIIGFGMGPNLLFAGRPQPGGITYGDIEVLQLNLGRGNDTVEIDYTTNAEDHTTKRSGDFYTLTMLDTGLGNDIVTINLHDGDDGAFALRLNQGNDTASATGSTLGIAAFGEAGDDIIAGGDGADTLFGDFGRIDYLDGDGEIITRLGHYLPLQAKNPPVVSATDNTVMGALGAFPAPDAFGGLVGLMVQAISPEGDVQFRRIVSHTTDTLTVDSPWDQVPNASYYYRVSTLPEDQSDGTIRGPRLAWTIDLVDGQGVAMGGADTVNGGGGDDLVIGGAYSDLLGGGAGNDSVAGDSVRFDYVPLAGDDGPARLNRVETIFRSRGGNDRIDGDGGDDIAIGGTGDDRIDGGAQDDLVLGDNVVLDWNLGVRDHAERFRTLEPGATTLYDANGDVQVGDRATPPGVQPGWAPWSIELDQTSIVAQFGNDALAGGANSDMLFGQRGNDTIQGDGNRESGATATRVGGVLTVSASIEAPASDGDDYIEGNAGLDVIFGNLGQDDIIGGSSTLYSLSLPTQRDDDADLVFGGAGNVLDDLKRNADGGGTQGEDADEIAGDNANIYRVVQSGGATSGFAEFAYDNDLARYGRAIMPRAVELVDYTPGNQDPLVTIDAGGADELHGESGDDAIYGMTGNDLLFGEGHDDDLIGGWGHDWISGGTGQDGVIGDDGRVMTSRNSATVAEPLHGIGTVVVGEGISTPGNIQTAVLHVNDALKKTVNLTPFNVQGEAGGQIQDPLFRPTLADDIIFGGWGDDFLHGGAGDDAMLGGEARATGLYSYATPGNNALGDALAFDETRGEFAAYKEYTPRVRIQEFLLDFEAKDGVAIGTTGYFTDGNDAIFGDLGNDWLVGGTGRDNLYGGWGDDLLNADDDLSTTGGTNDGTDSHATYEDRAFGGAGRDVLIGNTGGDRLIDWAGEFNSYVVPFSPYGAAAISRALQPQLPEFLYKLSGADGADPTRATDEGTDTARNGEPLGELGLIRQQDAAWHDQTGAPADPQAGNFPGGPRDVLRSASFNTGQMEGLAPDSGSWQVSSGALQVSADSLKSDAVAVYHVGDPLPSYYEVLASIKVIKPTAGWGANSFIIFDYQSKTNFKFAGLDVATNKIVMGQRTSSGWQVLTQSAFPGSVKAETWFNLKLAVNGLTATLMVNNQNLLSHVYQPTVVDGYSYGLNWGMVGFGSNKSRGAMDNIAVQVVPPASTVTRTDGFTDAGGLFAAADVLGGTATVGSGRYALMPTGSDPVVSLADLGNTNPIAALSLLEFSATLNTGKMAGVVFDRYGPTDYKFAAIDVTTQKVVIGHRIGSSWVIDAQFSRTLFVGTDYTLGVTLRGASVSVTLDGQAVGGFVYNAVTVDGRFGVIAHGGDASFDSFTAKTNDDGVPATLLSGSVASTPATAETTRLADAETEMQRLEALLTEAVRRWTLVEDDSHLLAARAIRVAVADLDDGQLARYADGTILLDVDAAGHGWFADGSPTDDSEFFGGATVMSAKPQGPAAGRIDLLSVLAHEIGHAIGLGHSEDGVMGAQLQPGQRATPEQWYAAARSAADPGFAARGPGALPTWSPSASFEEATRPALTIDWGAPAEATPVPTAPPAAASSIAARASWQQRFVNHAGASADRLYPNEGFKLEIPLAAKVVPKVSTLHARS